MPKRRLTSAQRLEQAARCYGWEQVILPEAGAFHLVKGERKVHVQLYLDPNRGVRFAQLTPHVAAVTNTRQVIEYLYGWHPDWDLPPAEAQAWREAHAALLAKDTPAYRRSYEVGWRYSGRPGATLDHLDGVGAAEAVYDGYLDQAAGREKWHLLHCPDHDHCGGN